MASPARGKVTWFELASSDVARAAEFYGELFGWEFNGDVDIYLAASPVEGGIAGGIIPATPDVGTYATFGVEVDEVDDTYARALDKGATSVVAPTDNPGGVRSAYLRDADGSLFAIYRFGASSS